MQTTKINNMPRGDKYPKDYYFDRNDLIHGTSVEGKTVVYPASVILDLIAASEQNMEEMMEDAGVISISSGVINCDIDFGESITPTYTCQMSYYKAGRNVTASFIILIGTNPESAEINSIIIPAENSNLYGFSGVNFYAPCNYRDSSVAYGDLVSILSGSSITINTKDVDGNISNTIDSTNAGVQFEFSITYYTQP